MKYVHCLVILIIAMLLLSCGNSHPKLMSIAVTPSTVTASMGSSMGSSMPTVTFTAIGKFDDGTSRMLSPTEGLTWMSASAMIATIDMNGVATCASTGVVMITAKLPVTTTMMAGMATQPTTSTISGTATLTCM